MQAVLSGSLVLPPRPSDAQRRSTFAGLQASLAVLPEFGAALERESPRLDGFLAQIAEPAGSFDAALSLQLALQGSAPELRAGAALRLGIGLAELDLEAPSGPLRDSARENASAALAELAPGSSRRLALRSPWPELDAELSVSLALLDALRRRWTPEQCLALLGALRGRTQAEQAAALGVSQPAVSQRLAGAGREALWSLRKRVRERIQAGLDGYLFEAGDLQ